MPQLIRHGGLHPAVPPDPCNSQLVTALMYMLRRFFVMAAFNLLYILTPELLPTGVRASAMGICITTSRLGGLAAPFVAVGMVEHGMVRPPAVGKQLAWGGKPRQRDILTWH